MKRTLPALLFLLPALLYAGGAQEATKPETPEFGKWADTSLDSLEDLSIEALRQRPTFPATPREEMRCSQPWPYPAKDRP